MAPILQIRLLGTCELRYGNDDITAVDSARLQSLLAYLLLHRSAPQLRQHVAFLFWPDTTEAQARTNLRKLLLLLRRALPDADQFLHVTTKTVQWRADAPLELDVDQFEQNCAADESPAAWQAAVDLYQGNLLPSCYDDWILPVREGLHQTFVETSDRLIERLEAAHEFKRAVHYAQRLLRHDPVRETAYRQLMRLYARLGERSSALRAYHDCATMLRRELDVEPNAETQSLYQHLMDAETIPAASPLAADPPIAEHTVSLFGRAAPWQTLQSLWSRLAPGRPHLVLITGEAGVGKTHLAEEYLHWAHQRGATVVRTRSWSGEGRIAYAPVTGLLRSDVLRPQLAGLGDVWLAQIARLLPELREERPDLPYPQPLQEAWQRQQFFDALARAIMVRHEPLLLLFDDLQWCDGQTLEWLRFLLRSHYGKPLLIVGTARVEDIAEHEALAALRLSLRQADQLTELELLPLNQADATLLATQMAGRRLEPEIAERLYRKTEGNPLFIVEAVRAGVRADDAAHAGAWSLFDRADAMPPRVQAVIQARLAQLSPLAQELAGVAATIGRSFTFAVLARAVQQDEAALIRGLDELWRRRVVREQETDAYDFSHGSIREVVYDRLSPIQRRMLHRNIAQAIEEVYKGRLDEVCGELAVHFEHAGARPQAVAYRLRAGNHALDAYALEDALRHFTRALALADAPALQADAYLGLGRAQFARDELDTALTNISQAQSLVEMDDRRARLYHLQAEIHFARYEVDRAESAALAAQQSAEAMGDQEIVCQSLSLLGQICSARGDLGKEVVLITRALTICRQTQNRWREGRTLADLGWLQAQRAEFAEAVVLAGQSLSILETTDDRAGVAFAWNVLGRAHGGCGNYAAAFAAFRHSREIAATIDHKFLLAQVPNMLGWLHRQLCDYGGALALDRQGVELAQRWEKTPAEISACINVALDLLHLDDPERAMAQLLQVQRQIERKAFGFHGWRWQLRLLHAQGLCRLALQEPEPACALAREGICLANATTSRKYVALNQALVATAQAQIGQTDEAIATLTSALELADEIGYQPLRWESRWRLAKLHAAAGHPDRSRPWLQQAVQIVHAIADGIDQTPLHVIFFTSPPVQAVIRAAEVAVR